MGRPVSPQEVILVLRGVGKNNLRVWIPCVELAGAKEKSRSWEC